MPTARNQTLDRARPCDVCGDPIRPDDWWAMQGGKQWHMGCRTAETRAARGESHGSCRECGLRDATPGAEDHRCSECAAAYGGACPEDPDGLHHVGCGCEDADL